MEHKVNLLPWREELREKHRRRCVVVLLSAVLCGMGILALTAYYIDDQIQQQKSRLDLLGQYSAVQGERIRLLSVVRDDLGLIQQKLSYVEEVKHARNKATDVMNQLLLLVPPGVYADSIKMKGPELKISGFSENTEQLAEMLDNLEHDPLITDVGMHSIVHDEERFGRMFQTFSLSFRFTARHKSAPEVNDELE